MSKNISILQDSEEKTLKKVEKIKTQLANGNVCYWVPEDEYPLGVLTVTEDGVYYPSTDPNGPYYGYSEINVSGIGTTTMGQLADIVITKNGTYESSTDSSGPYYGYAKVTVNVSGSGDGGSSGPTITGKDGDGDDAIVGTDEDGKIVTSKLPTRISINVYPNNLVYEDGQTIDFTGLRVKAFLPDDTEWGIVDDDQLIKPVTVAEGNGDERERVSGDGVTATVFHPKVQTNPKNPREIRSFYYGLGYDSDGHMPESCIFITGDSSHITLYMTVYGGRLYGMIKGAASSYLGFRDESIGMAVALYNDSFREIPANTPAFISICSESESSPIGKTVDDMETIPAGSQQTIPLQWKRPGDKKVLETSFTIAVHGSGDSGSGAGPAPTPSPG